MTHTQRKGDLGPNQLEWCRKHLKGFRACERKVKRALARAARAAEKAKGVANA